MKPVFQFFDKIASKSKPIVDNVDRLVGNVERIVDNTKPIQRKLDLLVAILLACIPFLQHYIGLVDNAGTTVLILLLPYLLLRLVATLRTFKFSVLQFPLILMVLAFLFSDASSSIQFTETIINGVLPTMEKIPQLMPLIIFIILGATEFITGTNWGLYIIALPIVIPLSQAVGGNTVLAISAVLSAGVFGSHICFYSDATIISSAACGCDNFEHGLSQMPYGFIGAGIAMILFTIAGFVMI